jgi:hypothetical protein
LRKATKDTEAKNTIVLSGLKLKEKAQTTGEFDFIIISLPLKSIIQIEAKKGNNEKNRKHADKQLNRGQDFFLKNCPFPSSENWKYTKMMCFGESVENDICYQCRPFVLSANFIELNMTQPIVVLIADQFKTYWNKSKVCEGKIKFILIFPPQLKLILVSMCFGFKFI